MAGQASVAGDPHSGSPAVRSLRQAVRRIGSAALWRRCSRSRSSASRRWLWLSDIAEIAQFRSRLGPRPGMVRRLLAG